MPTIVERSQGSAQLLATAVGGVPNVVANLEELKQHLASHPGEYAVILGTGVDLQAATAFADTLRVTSPATSVILIRQRVDASVLAEALRSGMREVIEERDLQGLGQAVRRAADLSAALTHTAEEQASPAAGQLITVFSPKGGVGKTTLAVNLAVALSQSDRSVCLVDLDLAFGDVAITLQVFPARTIANAAHMGQDLDLATLESLLTPIGDNLTTLVAPVQPDAKDTISAALVGRVLHLLKSEYDAVVVDTAPAFDEHVLQAFDESDLILLVTTLDVPTLKNVKMASETLDLLNYPKSKRHLVLNRADDKVGLTADKVEGTLGMTIVESIPSSPDVAMSTNAGEPITRSHPKHAVSQAVARLARTLSDAHHADHSAGTAVPAQPQGKRRAAQPMRLGILRRNGGRS